LYEWDNFFTLKSALKPAIAKLDWQPGILNLNGYKPKGMHWKTYLRQMKGYRDYANQALLGMTAKMGIMNNRVSAMCDRQ